MSLSIDEKKRIIQELFEDKDISIALTALIVRYKQILISTIVNPEDFEMDFDRLITDTFKDIDKREDSSKLFEGTEIIDFTRAFLLSENYKKTGFSVISKIDPICLLLALNKTMELFSQDFEKQMKIGNILPTQFKRLDTRIRNILEKYISEQKEDNSNEERYILIDVTKEPLKVGLNDVFGTKRFKERTPVQLPLDKSEIDFLTSILGRIYSEQNKNKDKDNYKIPGLVECLATVGNEKYLEMFYATTKYGNVKAEQLLNNELFLNVVDLNQLYQYLIQVLDEEVHTLSEKGTDDQDKDTAKIIRIIGITQKLSKEIGLEFSLESKFFNILNSFNTDFANGHIIAMNVKDSVLSSYQDLEAFLNEGIDIYKAIHTISCEAGVYKYLCTHERAIPAVIEAYPELFQGHKDVIFSLSGQSKNDEVRVLYYGIEKQIIDREDIEEHYKDNPKKLEEIFSQMPKVIIDENKGKMDKIEPYKYPLDKMKDFLTDDIVSEVFENCMDVISANKNEAESGKAFNQLKQLILLKKVSIVQIKERIIDGDISLDFVRRILDDEDLKQEKIDTSSLAYSNEKLNATFKRVFAEKLFRENSTVKSELLKGIDLEAVKKEYRYQRKMYLAAKAKQPEDFQSFIDYLIENEDLDFIDSNTLYTLLYGEEIFDISELRDWEDKSKPLEERLSFILYKKLVDFQNDPSSLEEGDVCLREEDRHLIALLSDKDNPITLQRLINDKKITIAEILDKYVSGEINKETFLLLIEDRKKNGLLSDGTILENLFKFDSVEGEQESRIQRLFKEAINQLGYNNSSGLQAYKRYYELFTDYASPEDITKLHELQLKTLRTMPSSNIRDKSRFKKLFKFKLISGHTIDTLLTAFEKSQHNNSKEKDFYSVVLNNIAFLISDQDSGVVVSDYELLFRDLDEDTNKRFRLIQVLNNFPGKISNDRISEILINVYAHENPTDLDIKNFNYLLEYYNIVSKKEAVQQSEGEGGGRRDPNPDDPKPEPIGIPLLKRYGALRDLADDSNAQIRKVGNTIIVILPKYNKIIFEMMHKEGTTNNDNVQHATYIINLDEYNAHMRHSVIAKDASGIESVLWEASNGGIRYFRKEPYVKTRRHTSLEKWKGRIKADLGLDEAEDENAPIEEQDQKD